ncbi:hypothetical protein [Paenibacillus silvisoli]|uniref:hypothetical protein n=1 Tax=Paenibacillus silvisoli TaxID=3110539 RepID=UPI002805A347|nr:hypothetical protein [Paenibacillus silvisoli]
MLPSVAQFMTRLIDYAGLFPPAELPMEEAVRQYARYSRDPDHDMLGRFVIPVSRLGELEPHLALFSPEQPIRLSVIGYRSRSSAECLELLTSSLARMESFQTDANGRAVMDTLELPLPQIPMQASFLNTIEKETVNAGLRTFCEFTYALDAHWEGNLLEAIHQLAMRSAEGKAKLGMKLRTGGLTPEAFPSTAQVALALQACRDSAIPLKFTAGLHHPIRMFRSEVNARMHGFLNVFMAGLLAHAHDLDRKQIEEIVADEDPKHFEFTNGGFHWKSLFLSTEQIQTYRSIALTGYGSCSFDEPRDELRELLHLEQGG